MSGRGVARAAEEGRISGLTHRLVAEARRLAKRLLLVAPLLLVLAAVMGFLMGEWLYSGLLGLGTVIGSVRLFREAREPHRLLQESPDRVASQVLERRDEWSLYFAEADAHRLAELHHVLDSLNPVDTWFHRHAERIGFWASAVGSVGVDHVRRGGGPHGRRPRAGADRAGDGKPLRVGRKVHRPIRNPATRGDRTAGAPSSGGTFR